MSPLQSTQAVARKAAQVAADPVGFHESRFALGLACHRIERARHGDWQLRSSSRASYLRCQAYVGIIAAPRTKQKAPVSGCCADVLLVSATGNAGPSDLPWAPGRGRLSGKSGGKSIT